MQDTPLTGWVKDEKGFLKTKTTIQKSRLHNPIWLSDLEKGLHRKLFVRVLLIFKV